MGIGTLNRKMTSFRQSENIIALQGKSWGSRKYVFDQTCFRSSVVDPFRCGRPHFLKQKTSDFLHIWCVRTDKEDGG